MKKYHSIFFFILLCNSLSAQLNEWEWLRVAGTSNHQTGRGVACDPAGNVYMTGFIDGPSNNFSGTLINSEARDIFITKYSPSGALEWARRAGSSGDDEGYGVTADPFGNVYVCGYFHSSATFFGSPDITLSSAGGRDIFIAKYNSSGNVLWAKRAGGSDNEDRAYSISADSNAVYLTGSFKSSASFGSLPSLSSAGGRDIFIASYSLTGAENWALRAGNSGDDDAYAIQARNGGVYVAGEFRSSSLSFSGLSPALSNAGNSDAFLVKYTSSGSALWQRRISGGDEDVAYDLAVSGGNVYVAGYFKSSTSLYNSGSTPALNLNAASGRDGFLAQYNSSTGNLNWAVTEAGNDDEVTYSIAVNSLGEVFCSGGFKGTLPFGPFPGAAANDHDVFVTKYNSSGVLQWGLATDGDDKDEAFDIAISSSDMGYLTGYTKSTPAEFDPFSAPNFGGEDIFLAKLKCAPPVISVSPSSATICSGNSLLLSASGALSYSWSPPATLSSSTDDTVLASPGSTVTYTVSGSNVTGCMSASAFISVTVQPVISNNIISGSQTICAGTSPAALSGTVPSGGTGSYAYSWESSPDNITWSPAAGINNLSAYSPGILSDTMYFRRTVSSGTCASLISNSVQISVQPAVSGNTISLAQTICAGNTAAALTGFAPSGGSGTYSYAWEQSSDSISWLPAAGVNNLAGYNPGVLSSSLYFRRIVSSGTCSAQSNVILINVYAPIADNVVSASQTICEGDSPATLTGTLPSGGSGSYSYLWEESGDNITWSPATGINSMASYSPAALSSNVYYRRTVSSYTCVDLSSNSVLITVQPAISNNIISASQTICSGDSAETLLSAGPSGGSGVYAYQWMQSADAVNWAAAAGISNMSSYDPGVLTDTVFYALQISSGACSGTFSSISNVVELAVLPALSNVLISSDQTVCAGQVPLPLSSSAVNGGNGAYTFIWTESSDLLNWIPAAGISSLPSYTPSSLSDTMYYRLEIASGACSGMFSEITNVVTVSVEQPLSANIISSDQSICYGTLSATLNGSTPTGGSGVYSYAWQQSSDSLSWFPAAGLNNLQDYNAGAITISTWYRRISSSGVCASSQSIPVKITVIPAIGGNVIASSQTICSGEMPALLGGSMPFGGTGSYTFLWMQSNGTGSWTAATGINTGMSYQPPSLSDTTYYILEVSSGACSDSSASTSNTVVINAVPPIMNNILSAPGALCYGAIPAAIAGTLPTGGDGSYSYLWEESPDGTLWLPATGISILQDYNPPALTISTSYRRHVSSSSCTSVSSAESLHVHALSTAVISGEDTVCSGTAGNLLVSLAGLSPWEIIYSDGSSTDSVGGISAAFYSLVVAPTSSSSYTLLSATDGNGCPAAVSGVAGIEVIATPVAAAGADQEVCGLSASLNALPSAGIGTWSGSGLFSPADTLPAALVTVSAYGSHTFSWTETNRMCSSIDEITVIFYEAPSSPFAGEDLDLLYQDNTPLSAASPAVGTGSWSVHSGSGTFSDASDPASNVFGLAEGNNELVWTLSNGVCPAVSDTILVYFRRLDLPAGFSPNGDGVNDAFIIPGIEDLSDTRLSIFNRWGNRVFEEAPYKNDWTGMNNAGQELPEDTYFYLLKINERDISGYIIIKRK